MANEIKHAFAHPEARSLASAKNKHLDRISLRDHIVAVEIGAFQAERDMTQRISFNVVVEVEHAAADLCDDVDLILSYDRVTEVIDNELSAERLNLLETLAERVADRILREPQSQRVFVRIEKLDREGGALGVEIVRSLADLALVQGAGINSLDARVVAFSNEALASPHLTGWLEQLAAMDAPLIVCVPSDDRNATRAKTSLAQAHIDLLSVEQSAWLFASYVPDFAVVGTRTEMDWATKNGQACVWAPGKFVIDAVESPLDLIAKPSALAHWLCEEIGALELVLIGEALPENARVPCRSVALGQLNIKMV